jgi:hypothetical protein
MRSTSRGSPDPTQTAAAPLIISDAEMAWLLAGAAGSCLIGHERTMAFVELGCDEEHLAIARILSSVASSRTVLPEAVLATLVKWLHSYADNPAQPQLHKILTVISQHQRSEALSTFLQELCDDRPMRHSSAHPCNGDVLDKWEQTAGGTHT